MPDNRYLILSSSCGCQHGGTESYVLGLTDHLAAHGKVRFATGKCNNFTQRFQDITARNNIPVIAYPYLSRHSRFTGKLANSWIGTKIFPFDLECLGAFLSLPSLRKAAKDSDLLAVNYPVESLLFPLLPRSIKKVIHFHGHSLPPLFNKLQRGVLNHTDLCITCSNWARKQLEAKMPGFRFEVIPNGIDPELFRPGIESPYSPDCAYDHSLPKIGIVARLSEAKGLEEFFHVARALEGEAEFFVAGPPDVGYQHRLDVMRQQPNIHLLGPIEHKALPAFYNFLDLFLFPTHFESQGIVLLEAQACGLPVISTKAGGVPESVRDGETATLVPVADHTAAIEATRYLINDRERRDMFGKAGIEWVGTHFQSSSLLEQTRTLYDSLIDSRLNP